MNPHTILVNYAAPAFFMGAILGIVIGLSCGIKIGHTKAQQQLGAEVAR